MSDFVKLSKPLAPSMPDDFYTSINTSTNHTHDSFYIFSLHKCASMMLQRTFAELGNFNGIPNVAFDSWSFNKNYAYTTENKNEIKNLFLPKGYWYGVFRDFCVAQMPDFRDFDLSKKSLLLIRDPRDILVSLYFSRYYSHAAPGGTGKKIHETVQLPEISIDDYAINGAGPFVETFKRYIDMLLPAGNTLVFRYEDIVFDKESLFRPALEFLDLKYPEDKLKVLIESENIIPTSEDKYKHIRQVTPGDHKKKLGAATIRKLTDIFAEILDYFGYPR